MLHFHRRVTYHSAGFLPRRTNVGSEFPVRLHVDPAYLTSNLGVSRPIEIDPISEFNACRSQLGGSEQLARHVRMRRKLASLYTNAALPSMPSMPSILLVRLISHPTHSLGKTERILTVARPKDTFIEKMVRVAVTQHEPLWLDLAGTVDKACQLMEEAADNGAQLITFPEVWIPGYPMWIWSVSNAHCRRLKP
jgi:hypothetical protein